jgi:hypothetical protein
MNHEELAIEAITMVKPVIEKMFDKAVRRELHIVVVDPRIKPWEASFNDAILYQESIRSGSEWAVEYDVLARNKAEQAWRDGRANVTHQTQHPTSLRESDCPYYGSFVYGNIVVACSGVQPWFDMMAAGWVAIAFEQLAMHQHQTM